MGLASLAIIRGYVVRRFAKWISGSWRMLPRAGGRCWLALAADRLALAGVGNAFALYERLRTGVGVNTAP